LFLLVLFLSTSQEIGWEEHLQNDLVGIYVAWSISGGLRGIGDLTLLE